jgi:copper(I)-binding protein
MADRRSRAIAMEPATTNHRPTGVIKAAVCLLALLAVAGCAAPRASGMTVTDAQAIPMSGNGNPLLVVATMRNDTGRDDKLIGATSPGAADVHLVMRVGETPGPTDPVTGIPNLGPISSWPIAANETIRFTPGQGPVVVSGLSQPLVVGQTLQVTFEFAYADPVTVQIPVVSAWRESDGQFAAKDLR